MQSVVLLQAVITWQLSMMMLQLMQLSLKSLTQGLKFRIEDGYLVGDTVSV
jgi:hypothetical protein